MTTVAYRDGILASDTQQSFDGQRCGHIVKIERIGRLRIGFCGATKNWEAFRDYVRKGLEGPFDSKDGNAFIIADDGQTVMWGDGPLPWRETETEWALGSGQQFALGAMAMGATPAQAISAAMKHDTATGGEITVLTPH